MRPWCRGMGLEHFSRLVPGQRANDKWWFSSLELNAEVDPAYPPNPRASFFGGGNPSAYSTHQNLLNVCEEASVISA
jgi:hypothetical protein